MSPKSKRGKTPVALTEEQARSFILYFFCEAKRRTVKRYKNTCNELKQELKAKRAALSELEPKQYSMMRSLIDNADEIDQKIVTDNEKQHEFRKKLRLETDGKIILQRAQIAELYVELRHAQKEFDKVSEKQREYEHLVESNHTDEVFQKEIAEIQAEFQEIQRRRVDMVNHMHQKHENSLTVTQKRAEIVISEAETVATQEHINSLSDEAVNVMTKNKDLKERVEKVNREYENLCALVEKMESDNREYVKRNVMVDWNLNMWHETEQAESDDDGDDDDEDTQDKLLDMGWLEESQDAANLSPEEEPESHVATEDPDPEAVQERNYKFAMKRNRRKKIPRPQELNREYVSFSGEISREVPKQKKLQRKKFPVEEYRRGRAERPAASYEAAIAFLAADLEAKDLEAGLPNSNTIKGFPVNLHEAKDYGQIRLRGKMVK